MKKKKNMKLQVNHLEVEVAQKSRTANSSNKSPSNNLKGSWDDFGFHPSSHNILNKLFQKSK